jgi:hypothetical protein
MRAHWIPMVLLALLPTAASGGPLSDAVDRADEGNYYFGFETREGVRGDGHSLSIDSDGSSWWSRNMTEGPGRVWMRIRDGEVVDVDLEVGGPEPRLRDSTIDLGMIDAVEVRDVLFGIAARTRRHDMEALVVGAVVSDGFEDWQPVLDVARNEESPEDLREAAIFWLGQGASKLATEGLVRLVEDDDVELELREHAIFSLSQQGLDTAFKPLRRVALHSRHAQLREQAFFWLAQHDDPRVIDLLEEVLLR